MAQHRPVSRRADEGGGRHPSQPYTFYIGMVNGGVWKTTDAGRTWKPIFDDQPTGSIGWVAVAPSDPEHPLRRQRRRAAAARTSRSATASTSRPTPARPGRTSACATRSRFRRSRSIPKNPNRLFVAALGHPYGPNEERGIFRSTDGGADVRARALQGREHRRQGRRHRSRPIPTSSTRRCGSSGRGRGRTARGTAPTAASSSRPTAARRGSQLTQGLPDGIVNAELAIAPSNPRRALRDASKRGGRRHRHLSIDDAGETWARSTTDTRPTSRINEVVPHVHPKDPDTLIVTDVVSYKSTDGGKTFVPFKGAPGGDDNQNIWWNPNNPDIMLLVVDQGAVVTLNGGQTWSSWYTQPTAALYHVMTDNAFPYRVCGGQQDSGSVVRRQPRQRRPDHVPRMASGRRRGIRLRRARSARSRHRLRRQGDALRPAHRAGVERRPASAGAAAARPRRAAAAIAPCARSRSCSRRSIRTRCSSATTCSGRRSTAGSTGSRSARISRARRGTCRRASAPTRRSVQTRERGVDRRAGDLHHRPVVHGHQPHLDRHRRRRDRDDRGRRAALDRRHAAAADRLHEGVHRSIRAASIR